MGYIFEKLTIAAKLYKMIKTASGGKLNWLFTMMMFREPLVNIYLFQI